MSLVESVELGLSLNLTQFNQDIISAKRSLEGLNLTVKAPSLTRELQQISNQIKPLKLTITPVVDHKPLDELNRHLDRKKAHVQELQRYFNSNPLSVGYSRDVITSFSGEIDRLQNKVTNFQRHLNASPFKVVFDTSNQSVLKKLENKEITLKGGSVGNEIKGGVHKANTSFLSELRKTKLKTEKEGFLSKIHTGFLESAGRELHKKFNVADSIEKGFKKASEIFKKEVIDALTGFDAGEVVNRAFKRTMQVAERQGSSPMSPKNIGYFISALRNEIIKLIPNSSIGKAIDEFSGEGSAEKSFKSLEKIIKSITTVSFSDILSALQGGKEASDKLNNSLTKVNNELTNIVESIAGSSVKDILTTIKNDLDSIWSQANNAGSGFKDNIENVNKTIQLLKGAITSLEQTEFTKKLQEILDSKTWDTMSKLVEPMLQERHQKGVKEKGVELAKKRAIAILEENQEKIGSVDKAAREKAQKTAAKLDKRSPIVAREGEDPIPAGVLGFKRVVGVDAPQAITEETKKLIIAVGGFTKEARSGDFVASQLLRDVAGDMSISVIGAESKDTTSGDQAANMAVLATPKLQGYTDTAVELAGQALSALALNPNLEIEIIGESGGGYQVEEAIAILNAMGIKNVKGIGTGTPSLIAGLNQPNMTKVFGIGDNLREGLQPLEEIGLTRFEGENQNVPGIYGHLFGNYRNTPEVQSFLGIKPELATQESSGLALNKAKTLPVLLKKFLLDAAQSEQGLTASTFNELRKMVAGRIHSTRHQIQETDDQEIKATLTKANNINQAVFDALQQMIGSKEVSLKQLDIDIEAVQGEDIKNDVVNFNEKLDTAIQEHIESALKQAQQAITEKQNISTVIPNIDNIAPIPLESLNFDNISTIDLPTDTIKQEIKTFVETINTAISEYFTEALNTLKNELIAVSPKGEEMAVNQSDNNIIGQTPIGKSSKNNPFATMEVRPSPTVINKDDLINNAQSKIKEIGGKFKVAYQDFKDAIATNDFASIQAYKATFDEIVNNGKTEIESLINELKAEGVETQVGSPIGSSVQGVKGQLTRKENLVEKQIKDVQKTRREILKLIQLAGGDIAGGLKLGIKSGFTDVKKVSKELAELSIDEVKQRLDIKSPSGVFEEIGKNLIKGQIKGIDTTKPQLFSVLQQAQNEVIKIGKSPKPFNFVARVNNIDVTKPQTATINKSIEHLNKQKPNTELLAVNPTEIVSTAKQAKDVLNSITTNTDKLLEAKHKNLEKATNAVLALADQYEDQMREIATKNQSLTFAVAGFSGKQGQGSHNIARQLQTITKGAVIAHENTATDISTDAKGNPKQWAKEAIAKLYELNVKGKVNQDAVYLAAKMLAALRENPNLDIKAVGHSAGGYVVEEAIALLRKLGVTNIKGVGVGTPGVSLPLETENFKQMISEGDPLGKTQALGEAIGLPTKRKARKLSTKGHGFTGYITAADTVEEINEALEINNKQFIYKIPILGKVLKKLKAQKAASTAREVLKEEITANQPENEIDKIKQRFKDVFEDIKKRFPIINDLSEKIQGMGAAALALFIITKSFRPLLQLAQQSFQVFAKLQSMGDVFRYASGSIASGTQQLKFAMGYAEKMKLNMLDAAEAYASIAAESKGTSLEGQGAKNIFTAITNAASALNLDRQKTGSAFLAVQQAIGKGKLSAEELRRQLSPALQGINVTALSAQSMGYSTAEFTRLMESGMIKSDEWALSFAGSLNAAVEDIALGSTNTAERVLDDLENTYTSIKIDVGNVIGKPVLFGLNLFIDGLKIVKELLPEITIGLTTVTATLASAGFAAWSKQIVKGLDLIRRGFSFTLAEMKKFFIALNTNPYAAVFTALAVLIVTTKRMWDSYHTELVKTWRQSADEAVASVKRIEQAQLGIKPKQEKEIQDTFAGKVQDYFTDINIKDDLTSQLSDSAEAFKNLLQGNIYEAFVSGFKSATKAIALPFKTLIGAATLPSDWLNKSITAMRGGGFNRTTWADVQRNNLIIEHNRRYGAHMEASMLGNMEATRFNQRQGDYAGIDAIDDRLMQARIGKAALETRLARDFKGQVVPAEYRKQLMDFDTDIRNLSIQRSDLLTPLTKQLIEQENIISDNKQKLTEINDPKSALYKQFKKDPEALRQLERDANNAIYLAEKTKAKLEEATSIPNSILRLQESFIQLSLRLAEVNRQLEIMKDRSQAIAISKQVADFSTDYFAGETASVTMAKLEQEFTKGQLEAQRKAIADGRKYLNDPRIAAYRFTDNTTIEEIERTLTIGDAIDPATKILIEKIKEYKELEKTLPQLERSFAQSQLSTKQAIETASIAKIQQNIDELKGKLAINYNRQLQTVRSQLLPESGSLANQENIALETAQLEINKIEQERRLTRNQISQIERAYRRGDISRKTYVDQLNQLRQQLADQETAVLNARISQNEALRSYYQAELTSGNQIFESANTIVLNQQRNVLLFTQLKGLEDAKTIEVELARLEQKRIKQSIEGINYQLKQNEFLYHEKLITDREYTTQRLQLESQLSDMGNQLVQQQITIEESIRQRKINLIDIEIAKTNNLVQIQSAKLDRLEKELDIKSRSLDLDKQLLDSRQNLSQAIAQQGISALEAQLQLAQNALSIFDSIKADTRLFSGNNYQDLTHLQRKVTVEYENVIARQTGISPNEINNIRRQMAQSNDELTTDRLKYQLLQIELGLLDKQFALENEIANKKLEALKTEQSFQQKLLQIDLERTKLQSQQAIFAAQRSKLTARGEIFTAEKELEKAGLINDPIERMRAEMEAKFKLDMAKQSVELASMELAFAERNLSIQDELARNAIATQQAQQETALAQEQASQYARTQAQELERAKRAMDAMVEANREVSGQSATPNRRITGFQSGLSHEMEQAIFNNTRKSSFSRKFGEINPTLSNLANNFSYRSNAPIANPDQISQFASSIDRLNSNIESVASRPTNLYVSSSNPTSDAAQIYNDFGKIATRSNNL